ncbi:MAG: TlpA family protein disulfide reductase [Chloroflexota bacterium]
MAGVIRVHKPQLWLLLGGAILLLLGLKAMPGFVAAGPPLELDNRPAFLFFNSEEGCDCVIEFYEKADAVMAAWPSDAREDIPVHRILLEERPDLQRQYKVDRPPTLILLDAEGREIWRDRGVASNPQVFKLEACAQAIQALNLPPTGGQ